MKRKLTLGMALGSALCLASLAQATVYYDTSFESVAVGHEINDESIDGKVWDTGQNAGAGASFPFPFVRSTVTTPAGTKYVEVLTKCPGGNDGNGRCAAPNNETTVSISAFVDITGIGHTIVASRTYYLGAFMRYDKVSNNDQWLDSGSPNNWDKTLEYRGTAFRWGIGVGWPQGNYTATNGKYTFDLWCADTGFTGCQTGGNPDHKVQNDNGYSGTSPFLADYGKWYAVVMKVVADTTTAGSAELYINGVRIINKTSQVTYNSGGTISDIELWGTLSQADYDRPVSTIMMDRILMSDSLTDMQNAGLMSDPEAGGGRVTMFIGQSAVAVLAGFQYLMILSYLWERRQKAIQAVLAVHAWYWTVRYRQALRRWQREAPIMLEYQGETIELSKQEQQAWQLRK